MKTILETSLLVALIATSPALAQQGGGQGGGSGQQGRGSRMGRSGAQDQDRMRDQDRLRTPGAGQGGAKAMGRDRDGKLSASEHAEWRTATFDMMDADGDGRVSRAEYMAVRMGPDVGGLPWRRNAKATQAQERKTQRFEVMDGDGDGYVERERFMRFGEQNYADIDQDKDGSVSLSEFQNWHRGQ